MKLRFRENSLRLRVNRREVETLASGAAVEEQVQFPGDVRLAYVLRSTAEPAAKASFEQGVIHISAPRKQIADWAGGDSIGLYFDLPANGAFLRVAIEKDLECVDGPEEERDPDAFPRIAGKKC
jgi:hypothetical protein